MSVTQQMTVYRTHYESVIIGAGAAGLFCATYLVRHGMKDILLLEKDDRPGRKLSVCGNGRCNLSNRNVAPKDYNRDHVFSKAVFERCPGDRIHRIFESWGLPLRERAFGRLYPRSDAASSVIHLLTRDIETDHSSIRYSTRVSDILHRNDQFVLTIENDRPIRTRNLVMALGCPAYARLRPGNDGFRLATSLGHRIVSAGPALVPLTVADNWMKSFSGLKTQGSLKLLDREKVVTACEGDLIVADYGFSGTAAMDLSIYLDRCRQPFIEVTLLSDLSEDEFRQRLSVSASLSIASFLSLLFPKRVVDGLIRHCLVEPSRPIDLLGPEKIEELIESCYRARFVVTGTRGLNEAQVVGAGVDFCEIEPETMESKKIEHLYLLGDMIAGSGRCGGYNLHFAWTSALIAAESLLSSIKPEICR